MIDKLTPRFLDKSSDEKLVQKTSFVDALNAYVDGDIDAESAGVIKSIKGTDNLSNTPYFNSTSGNNWFCLGHVTDQNTGIVYFFMVSSQTENHGIWAYDHRGVLPTRVLTEGSNYTFKSEFTPPKAKSLHRIATSHHFNFPAKGHVAADIVYANSSEFAKQVLDGYPEKDVLLYFTDNKNEPRMINVYRAYLNNGLDGLDRQEINDFINACPRVPLKPITFTFKNDPDVVVNNFAAAPGFQFAYQNIYKDGLESAISPYSDIAFPPSIINRGASQKDNILAHNKCELTIPPQNSEVESVRILARYGNGANFVEIDEIDNPDDSEPIKFDFLNDRVAGGVSTQTTDKTFDNLPRRAESQTVVSNRLVYGNYVEGFDNVDCSGVSLEPIYAERPLELLDYSFDIKPSIELTGDESGEDTPGDVQNKTIGFKIDADQFADTIEANTFVKVSFTFAPDKNFHIYNTTHEFVEGPSAQGSEVTGLNHESYHQSRQVGDKSLNVPGYNTNNISEGSAAASQEQAYRTPAKSGSKYLQQARENYFGNNKGVGTKQGSTCKWRLKIAGGFTNTSGTGERKASFGTSAANPLILQGGSLNFSVEFVVNERVSSGAKGLLLAVVTGLLNGDTISDIASEAGFDEGLFTVGADGVKNTHTHSINLGLSDYDKIPPNSDIGSMICGGHVNNLSQDVDGLPPQFAFVVNKAEVPFYLEKVPGTTKKFRICVENVYVNDDDSVVTCVKDLDPYSPWFAITPTTLDSADFTANFLSIWSQNLSPTPRVFKQINAATPADALRNFSERFPKYYNTAPGYPAATAESLTRATMTHCFGIFIPRTVDGDKVMLSATGGVDGSFEFSMLDGEGGPGGKGSPGDAYDLLGCENYGSIAAQVFIEYDQDSISKVSERGYVAYAFSGDPDEATSGEHLALKYINNPSILSEFNEAGVPLSLHEVVPGGYIHRSVLQGPFYTGRIVINNITSSTPGLAYVNPAGTSMPGDDFDFLPTTTLPLVWFSSWTKYPSGEGSSAQDALILDTSTAYQNTSTAANPNSLGEAAGGFEVDSDYTDYQVSFPYPIVVGTQQGGSGGFVDGQIASGELVEDPFGIGINSVDFERLHSHCEIGSVTTSVELGSFQGGNSFKAGATHEFGIVYYDERGRHGYVNPIGSVFIKTLGERDDANKRGAAFVKASNITHTPPSWAKSYRFAYSKNTSINKFIQYSAGGGFVANSDYEGGNPSEIYVSLNYLQGHPISYANSFGAKGRDGTPVMYSFTPGDRLRVISYMLSQTGTDISRVYPNNVEFEVTGVTQFTDQNNPFSYTDLETNEVVTTEAMKGLFLVLKNNIDAQGFRHQDIEQGGDNWGNNCVFEIYSPAREVDSEDRLYYEIGDTYPIVYAGTEDTDLDGVPDGGFGYFHKNQEVVLTQGDVFFRRHAVNFRDFEGFNGFVDLLDPVNNEDEEVASEANFKSYYLESEAATDLFPSRAISIGRPNVIKLDARESKRQSSLMHSDRDVVESSKVGYSSFNRTIASDLEIDFKAGPIHYMCNHQDSIFFVQNNKCGHIPVDRTLISDASGSQSLIASSKFLGTPRYYAGDAGCDGDPESVVNIDTTAYFVNKSIGKVYKVHPANGVNVISDNNMSGFFRSELAGAVEGSKRIIGGYDPVKKEYLLSVVDNPTITYDPITPEIEEGVFEPITVNPFDGGGVNFEGFGDDEIVEEEEVNLFPAVVRFDWSIPSNLQSPTWTLVYEDGDVNDLEGENIIGDFSTWKTSANGAQFNALELDFALRCTVENPHNLPEASSGYLISFVGSSEAQSNSAWSFTFTGDDLLAENISLVRQLTLPYSENQTGNNWHFKRDFSGQVQCFTPLSYEGVLTNNFQLTVSKTGLQDGNVVEYSDGDVLTFDIPIRFVCREETNDQIDDSLTPFEILRAFVIGNVDQASCTVSDRLKIESVGGGQQFKIGNTQNNNTSVIRDFAGNISWQAAENYDDFEVGVDTGGSSEPIPFNPSNPVYGLCPYVIEGGLVTQQSVTDWLEDSGLISLDGVTEGGPFYLWLELNGISVDDPDYDAELVSTSLFSVLENIVGETISCYIIDVG